MISTSDYHLSSFLEDTIDRRANIMMEGVDLALSALNQDMQKLSIRKLDTDYMKKMLKSVSSMVDANAIEIAEISTTFTKNMKTGKKDYCGFDVAWATSPVKDIHLKAVKEFTDRIERTLATITNDSDVKSAIDKYNDNYLCILQQKVCDTTFPKYIKEKDFMLAMGVATEKKILDNSFISSNVFPLLDTLKISVEKGTGYSYNNSIVHIPFGVITKEFCTFFNQVSARYQCMLELFVDVAIEKKLSSGKVYTLIGNLQQLLFNLLAYISTCAYIFMIVPLKNFNALKDVVHRANWNVTGAADITTMLESGEEDYHLRNTTELEEAARTLAKSIQEFAKGCVPEDEAAFDLNDGDRDAYDIIYPFIQSAKASIIKVSRMVYLGKLDSVEDCIRVSKLSETELSETEDNIVNRIHNLDHLARACFRADFLYGDLMSMTHLVPQYIGDFDKIIENLESLIHTLDRFYMSPGIMIERSELETFYCGLHDRLLDMRRRILSAYYDRLKMINQKCIDQSCGAKKAFDIVVDDDRFFANSFADSLENYEESVYEEMDNSINAMKEKYLRSMISVFTEADNNQNNGQKGNNVGNTQQSGGNQPQNGNGQQQNNSGGNNGNNQSQNNSGNSSNQNSGNNQNNGNNAQQQNQQNNQQNQNNGNNAQQNKTSQNNAQNKNDTKPKKNFSQSLQDAVQFVIDRVQAFFDNGSKKKNLKFLEDHKDGLLSMSFVNKQISLLPYLQKKTDYGKELSIIFQNAKKITADTLRTATEEQLTNMIFESINIASIKGDKLEDRIIQGLEVGTKKLEEKPIINSAIKDVVPGMVSFLENYFNNFTNSLISAKEEIKNISSLNLKGSGNNGDRTDENVEFVNNLLNTAIHAVREAGKKRSNDYINALHGLVFDNKGGSNGGNQSNNQDQNGNNQNNQ